MNKNILVGTLLLSSVASFYASAASATITKDWTEITTDKQTYSDVVALTNNYENVVLSLTAKGDYGKIDAENIVFKIDGVTLADWTWDTAGIDSTENYLQFDYTLSGTVSIATTLWNSFAADNVLNISWSNGANVNPYAVEGGSDYVYYRLDADISEVPVPAAAFLFAPALLGFMGLRRKSKNTAA